ncbi:MAG: hypothetical protein LBP98_01380 [Tannerella sp.]|jgi:hypothetical protein|nr:hypothetical protein [Tannerella sp.]
MVRGAFSSVLPLENRYHIAVVNKSMNREERDFAYFGKNAYFYALLKKR